MSSTLIFAGARSQNGQPARLHWATADSVRLQLRATRADRSLPVDRRCEPYAEAGQ
ncbi:MAG: hypothetical protein ACJ8AG_05215 [Ktedonobacteraceae bacterium]